MTDLLQPVEIVPNGPIKAHIKRARSIQLYEYSRSSTPSSGEQPQREQQARAPAAALVQAPRTDNGTGYHHRARGLLGPLQDTPEFQESIRKCFVIVGLAPCTKAGSY